MNKLTKASMPRYLPLLTLASLLTTAGAMASTYAKLTVPTPLPASAIGAATSANPLLKQLKSTSAISVVDNRAYSGSGNVPVPLCVSQDGWIGSAFVDARNGSNAAYCVVDNGSDRTARPVAHLLQKGTTHLTEAHWLRWSKDKVIPRGAAIGHQQTGGRALAACMESQGSGTATQTVLGYVGDDGRCYGVAVTGFSTVGSKVEFVGAGASFNNYFILMRQNPNSTNAQLPSDGWISVKNGNVPPGRLERVGGRDVCVGSDGQHRWPGFINAQTKECELFTYYGATSIKKVRDYEVHRYSLCTAGSASSTQNGVLNRRDGQCQLAGSTTASYRPSIVNNVATTSYRVANVDYFLCQATEKNTYGGVVRQVTGFTNRPGSISNPAWGCTDGTTTIEGNHNNKKLKTLTIFEKPGDGRG